jgi:hypothetical protein
VKKQEILSSHLAMTKGIGVMAGKMVVDRGSVLDV